MRNFQYDYLIILFFDQNGPNTLEKSSAVHAEAPSYLAPDFQASPSHPMLQNQPLNFSKQNVRLSQGSQNLASRQSSIDSNRVSSTPHTQTRPSGMTIWSKNV